MKKFDLTTVYNKDRPLSWSGISAFEWRPSGWHQKYVVHGKCTRANPAKGTVDFCVVVMAFDPECPVIKKTPELEFGSMIDTRIQEDPSFLPNLVRYPILQHEMTGTFNKIPLLGFADTVVFEMQTPMVINNALPKGKKVVSKGHAVVYAKLRDYKTGRKPWDQKRADQTGQLTMYLFMLYLRDKIKPEDVECFIDWLPTHIEDGKVAFIKEGDIRTFKTKRTMRQVLAFGQRIKDVYAAMEEYASRQAEYQSNSLKDW